MRVLQAAAPASSHEQAQTHMPDDDNSAPAPAPDAVEFIREENAASPLLAPMPGPAFAPSPVPLSAIINYNGKVLWRYAVINMHSMEF